MASVSRILMTCDTVGGVWTYALELVRALTQHRIEAALATMGAPLTPAQRTEARGIRGLAVYESRFRLEWMDEPWEDVERAGRWLLELERTVEPDLVHLNGYVHAALRWRAPVLVAGHSCVLSWWEAVKGEPAPASWDRYREEVGRGIRAADAVVAPTRSMLAALERHYGPVPNGTVIPNAREAARFRPGPKEALVLAAGRIWDEAKNIGALDSCAAELPWPVLVAGEDRHPAGGRRGARNVRLLGKLSADELAGWLARAAIYALPARYEPFGLSALEAALAGCALVLGDIPSLREVWGDSAIFIPPEEPARIGSAIRRLIEDVSLRGEMARRARCRALEYPPGRMAEGYVAAYDALLAARTMARYG